MERRFLRIILRAACALPCAALACCTPFREDAAGTAAQITVRIAPEGYTDTRSSFSWDESAIRDIQVVVTQEDGTVHDVLYSDSPSDLQFTGEVGRLYKLWAAANLGGRIEVKRLEDFTEAIRSVTASGIAASGMPMCSDAGVGVRVSEGTNNADIRLTRMMARVDFKVDRGRLENPAGFRVKAVRICNPVNRFTPFSDAVRRERSGKPDYSFDEATSSDLSSINSGYTISLYAFENMQGTLLPGNTDPWEKVPSRIGQAADYCTWLEADCSYENSTGSCESITYRMYLGSDATTNFDVLRNTLYRVTLIPTETEIQRQRGSWKIEAGQWEDNVQVELVLSPSTLELKVGEISTIESYFLITEAGSSETLQAYARWTVNAASSKVITYSSLGTSLIVGGLARGKATVKARATYGGITCETSAEGSVVEPDSPPTPDPEPEPDPDPDPDPDPEPEPDPDPEPEPDPDPQPDPDPEPDPGPDPVPTLRASVTDLDTWGGNSYALTLTYDDGLGHRQDVTSSAHLNALTLESGAPQGLVSWDGSGIVAQDWWGMSGSWVSSSPGYTLSLSYEGLTVEVSGTMHGYTGAEVSPTQSVWHYSEIEENGWYAPEVKVVLTGSERTEVEADDRYVVDDSDYPRYIWDNGYIGVGSGIPLHVEFTDPSNGIKRSADTSFDVVTNVVELHVSISASFAQGHGPQSGMTASISTSTSSNGAYLGNAGIRRIDSGYPPFMLAVTQGISYTDYRGRTHSVTSSYGQADFADSVSISGGWSLESSWVDYIDYGDFSTIEIDVNGFSASWHWGYIGDQ